jgi:hypothetical protein
LQADIEKWLGVAANLEQLVKQWIEPFASAATPEVGQSVWCAPQHRFNAYA